MKKHHSRRERPAGQRARYALRPRELAPGLSVGGRQGIILLWIEQGRSEQRRDLRRFCARHGLLLEPVQRFGGRKGLHGFLATGEPPALAQLAGFPMVRQWEYDIDATVREPRLPHHAGAVSVPLAQALLEGRKHKVPLPPLPGTYTFASK